MILPIDKCTQQSLTGKTRIDLASVLLTGGSCLCIMSVFSCSCLPAETELQERALHFITSE